MKMIRWLVKSTGKIGIKILFNIMKLLPIKKNRIVLDSWKGSYIRGNIEAIYREIKALEGLEIIIIGEANNQLQGGLTKVVPSMSLRHIYYLATSKYWIVDTLYYVFLAPRKEVEYILVWHAAGLFKKFGLSCNTISTREANIYRRNGRRLTHLVVSSPKVKNMYSEALGVPLDKVLPIGIPRTDAFINGGESTRLAIYRKYQIEKHKMIILYAPTFRGEGKSAFKMALDMDRIKRFLGETYVMLIKLHPNNYIEEDEKALMCDSKIIVVEEKLEELMKASEILVTDYSSIIFEYSLLEKPMFFYAYDLKDYINSSRGFYEDYMTFIPGPLVYTTEALISAIKKYDIEQYRMKIKRIADDYQIHDGSCTKRLKEYFFRDFRYTNKGDIDEYRTDGSHYYEN